MRTASGRRPSAPARLPERRPSSRAWHGGRRCRPARAAVLAWGVGLAVIVGADGSPPWQLGRVLGVAALTAAGWWLAGRPGRRSGAASAAWAAVGLAVGSGIGVRFAVAGAWGRQAAAGLVVLAAGVVLAWWSIRRVASGLALGPRIGVTAAGVVVLAVATWVGAPAVLADNVPPTSPDRFPGDVGLVADDVRFRADDGVELAAWYVPSTTGAAVVLRHGAGSTGADALDQAAVLAAHGYGVLVTDARGHGRSGGRAMDFGWYGDADVTAAVTYLSSRSDVDPDRIGVVGLSMGGEESLGALGADDRIAAVVAEGATARTAADKAWLDDVYGVRGRLQLGIERVQYALTDLLTDASPPRALADAVAAEPRRPVLLITAGDVPDEGHAAAHLRDAAPATVEIWTVDDAGHTGGLAADPEGWERTVIGFLDDTLTG